LTDIADLCRDLPIATFKRGDVLMREGERTGRLYVLLEGEVEITKEDVQINVVSDRGAIFGDMSALLDIPHMATVRALTPCSARVSDDGDAFLSEHPELAHELAKLLAQRLHGVTAYLVDLKHQFEDEQNHLGMVDDILETLVHQQRTDFVPGSDRDPEY
jgi:CRP/FNR family transcriptional regulator, cyclic AMP receptor protein